MDRALEARPTDWLATGMCLHIYVGLAILCHNAIAGHYARVGWTDPPVLRPRLLRSVDRNKDQTYYLSSVPETKLRRVSIYHVCQFPRRRSCLPNTKALFPVGNLTKVEVRKLARIHGLPTAARDESMGICFVGQKRRFNAFLCRRIPVLAR